MITLGEPQKNNGRGEGGGKGLPIRKKTVFEKNYGH